MPKKSTTAPLQIRHEDDDDVLIIRLDIKDPVRQKLMTALQQALETDNRQEEASRAKAYAQEKLPDDWRRKQPARSGNPDDPGTREFRKPPE
jgi:hypothetical protein